MMFCKDLIQHYFVMDKLVVVKLLQCMEWI